MARRTRKKQGENSIDFAIEQILLHLHNSIDGGFSYTAKRGLFMLGKPDWKVNKKDARDGIRELNKQKLIQKKNNYDGSILISLTEKGRLRALNIRFRKFYDRKEKWDGKWRMVSFDIPDECRKARDALRYRLKQGGFYEIQESLFLYPHDCQKEIEDFKELFKVQKYVRFGLLDFIDINDDEKITISGKIFHWSEKTHQ